MAGEHCSLGTYSELQGFCPVGDYTRLHSSVHVGQGCSIGSYVWVFPSTILLNDPHPPSERIVGATIGDFAVVAAGVLVFPRINIGESSLVVAGAIVRIDLPPGTIAASDPARILVRTTSIPAWDATGSAYPWPRHFSRGMPKEPCGYADWARKSPRETDASDEA